MKNPTYCLRGRFLFTIVFLLSLFSSQGCKKSDKTSTETIRLGVMSSMDFVPFALALEQGYYDSIGLKVEVVPFFSANERDVALQSGQIDATVTDYTGAVLQVSGGIKAKMLMSLDGIFTWVGRRNGMRDYKDASFAVSNKTVIDYITDALVEETIPEILPIRKVEVNKIPLRLEMLRKGEIDATVLPDPFTTMAELESDIYTIANTQEIGRCVTCILVLDEYAQKNSDALNKLVEGYNWAVDNLTKIPRTTIDEVINTYAGAPELIAPLISLPPYRKATAPVEKDVQSAIDWLNRQEALTRPIQAKELIGTWLSPSSDSSTSTTDAQ